MKAIKLSEVEAIEREDFAAYFLVPLSFAFDWCVSKLGYSEGEFMEQRKVREQVTDALVLAVPVLIAYRREFRAALLPTSVVKGMLWDDLIGFSHPDRNVGGPSIVDGEPVDETGSACTFVPRSLDHAEFAEFADWDLYVDVADFCALTSRLDIDCEGDKLILHRVHGVQPEAPPVSDAAKEEKAIKMLSEWVAMKKRGELVPTQLARVSRLMAECGLSRDFARGLDKKMTTSDMRKLGRPPSRND